MLRLNIRLFRCAHASKFPSLGAPAPRQRRSFINRTWAVTVWALILIAAAPLEATAASTPP